jgi:hypothetical protein
MHWTTWRAISARPYLDMSHDPTLAVANDPALTVSSSVAHDHAFAAALHVALAPPHAPRQGRLLSQLPHLLRARSSPRIIVISLTAVCS